MIGLLLALFASAQAIAADPGPHTAHGPPGGDAYVVVAILPEGPFDVAGAQAAALRSDGGPWTRSKELPARFAPVSGAPHALRFRLRVPEEPATLHVRLSDEAGGLLLPIRIVPDRGPPPPVPEEAPEPGAPPPAPTAPPPPPAAPPGRPPPALPVAGPGAAAGPGGGSPEGRGEAGFRFPIPVPWVLAPLAWAALARRRD